jgi:hypothetical protein
MNFVHTSIDTLTQKDYRATRPTLTNVGHNVLYRTGVLKLLAHNTLHRRDDPR